MESNKPKISNIQSAFSLNPQEALLDVKSKKGSLYIGLPKEQSFQDNRIGLTPQAVGFLVNNGHKIVIESKAGERSNFSDKDFSEFGGEIKYSTKDVFDADVIIKVAPPTLEEIDMLHPGQTIISPIHLPTLTTSYIQKLIQKRVTAVSLEYIKDDANSFPIVRSMSEIAGSTVILIGADLLSNNSEGRGSLLGGITGVPPTKVVILGAGVVGEFATRAALGLGAEVRVFDDSTFKLMRLQNNVGTRIFTSIINQEVLTQELKTADIAIGAIHSEEGRTPCIVNEHMVSEMKEHSVIIDVSIDQGGCFETSEITTHEKPTFKKFDIIHYCVPNIPSRVSRTASYAISNTLTKMLMDAGIRGGFESLLRYSEGTRHGVYAYKGCLTNHHLSERFGIKFTDLELLFTARL